MATISYIPANPRRTIYVGGLSEEVTTEILYAAFLPFGDITECVIPTETVKSNNDMLFSLCS